MGWAYAFGVRAAEGTCQGTHYYGGGQRLGTEAQSYLCETRAQVVLEGLELAWEDKGEWHEVERRLPVLPDHLLDRLPQILLQRERCCLWQLVDALVWPQAIQRDRVDLPSAPEEGPVALDRLDTIEAMVTQDDLQHIRIGLRLRVVVVGETPSACANDRRRAHTSLLPSLIVAMAGHRSEDDASVFAVALLDAARLATGHFMSVPRCSFIIFANEHWVVALGTWKIRTGRKNIGSAPKIKTKPVGRPCRTREVCANGAAPEFRPPPPTQPKHGCMAGGQRNGATHEIR